MHIFLLCAAQILHGKKAENETDRLKAAKNAS